MLINASLPRLAPAQRPSALLALGRCASPPEAVRHFAAAATAARGGDPRVAAWASFLQAKALGEVGRSAEARRLAGRARSALARAEGAADELSQIDAWLASHPEPGAHG